MAYKIYGGPDEPHLEITVDGDCVLRMSLDSITAALHETLAIGLDSHFQRACNRAAAKAVREHQAKLRGLLGVVS